MYTLRYSTAFYQVLMLAGATDHLKRKCPQKEEFERTIVVARKEGQVTGGDEDAYHEKLREQVESRSRASMQPLKKKPKIVKF